MPLNFICTRLHFPHNTDTRQTLHNFAYVQITVDDITFKFRQLHFTYKHVLFRPVVQSNGSVRNCVYNLLRFTWDTCGEILTYKYRQHVNRNRCWRRYYLFVQAVALNRLPDNVASCVTRITNRATLCRITYRM